MNTNNDFKIFISSLYSDLCNGKSPDYYETVVLLLNRALHGDVRETAKLICARWHELRDLLDADFYEIKNICDSEIAAVLICLLPQLFRRMELERYSDKITLLTEKAGIEYAGEYLVCHYMGASLEFVTVCALDGRNRPYAWTRLYDGTLGSVAFTMRKIAEFAVSSDSNRIIVAHNHSDGNPQPSETDISTAEYMNEIADILGFRIAANIIVSGKEYRIIGSLKDKK